MVPLFEMWRFLSWYSPRIRGDGPTPLAKTDNCPRFSPYSRGWSGTAARTASQCQILPVFAGMVPAPNAFISVRNYSPRIRGDGPSGGTGVLQRHGFSPYSRGWSRNFIRCGGADVILPVFAGMVPNQTATSTPKYYSPRIRGDGPLPRPHCSGRMLFSPYSRGWSLLTDYRIGNADILPVFAGMVPHPTAR